jgi:hypothetical protein
MIKIKKIYSVMEPNHLIRMGKCIILNRHLFFCCIILLTSTTSIAQNTPHFNQDEQGGLAKLDTYWGTGLHFDLKVSLDWANTIEKGNSSFTYDSKNRENILIYMPLNLGNPFADPSLSRNSTTEGEPVFQNGGGEDHNYESGKSQKPQPTFVLGFGLEYIGKGAKYPEGGGSVLLNYIEVPTHIMYYYPAGPGYGYGGFGPYFAYGIGGMTSGQSSFGESAGGYKRFDFGMGFKLGYQMDLGFSLDVGYDLGLANIAYSSQDVTSHNRCFFINVGYDMARFFRKK